MLLQTCFPRLCAVILGKIAAKVRVPPERFADGAGASSGVSFETEGLAGLPCSVFAAIHNLALP